MKQPRRPASKQTARTVPKSIQHSLLSLRELINSVGPFLLLAAGLLAVAYWVLDPTPPKRVNLATGPAQSAYAEFGSRYAALLKKNGIEVKLLPSQGSSENLQMLQDGRADLGFVQGGSGALQTGTAAEPQTLAQSGIQSLGSLFLEPLWPFYQADAVRKISPTGALSALPQLVGLRVNVGTPGSGVPDLMGKIFEVNRMDVAALRLSKLEQTPATVAFLNGELDALVFASAPESQMVQMLLQTPGVRLLDFAQNEAYSRRFEFLAAVTLPRGVVDLAANVPAQDVRLVAPTTTLLAREKVHPAILQLFAQASLKLHGGAGWFNRAREFPNAPNSEFPLVQEAERTLKNGVPLMQRYVPFSWANLIERMWLALGIILAVLLPLSRVVPPLYQFRIRSRIFRWYGQLRDIEDRLGALHPNSATGGLADEAHAALAQELTQMQAKVEQISVPLSYTNELYALRSNIELVRKKLPRI